MPDDIIALPRQSHETTGSTASNEGRANDILAKLEIENKIKEGAENLLQVFEAKKKKEGNELVRKQVEGQLDAANAKIQLLTQQLAEIGITDQNIRSDDSRHTNDIREGRERGSQNGNERASPGRDESPTWMLGDILQSFGDTKQESETIVERSNELVSLLQRYPVLKYDLVGSQVGDKIRVLLLHKKTEVIAAGYRVARHILTDLESIKKLRGIYLDLFIIRSLARDSKYQLERLQALKLVRSFLDIPRGVSNISAGVIRAIVAIAEQSDDRLKNVCLETLAEILVQDPQTVSNGGGIRVLIQCMVDGPFELSYPVGMALVYILDSPDSAGIIRNGRDLDYLVSAFTENQVKGHAHTDRLQNCAKVLAYILRTWPGIQAFAADNFFALKSLIQCLTIPTNSMRDILLDLFFSIFDVKPLSWSSSFLAGRRLTTLGRIPQLEKTLEEDPLSGSKTQESRYMDHYNSLLLFIFLECGLEDGLVTVLETSDDVKVTRKATLLLGELLSISSKILPLRQVEKLASLPMLVKGAVSRKTERDAAASAAVFQIDKISRNLQKGRSTYATYALSSNINSSPSYHSISKHVRTKLGVQIDDASFKQLILDTHVLSTKTYTKWNWDALSELIQGPLLNPKRLEEAMKTTKFMKRLVSFYRPFKYRFSSIKRTKPNQKYIQVGCELLTTLLYTPEGVKYLTENKLLRQIAECLAQLDPMSGIISAEPLFSSQRLQNTLSYGYFQLLGTLSADPSGIAMLERWRMFNMFYHLTDLSSRTDLIKYFISSMDYRLEGHPRIILSKALIGGQKDIQIFATGYLRTLLNNEPETQKWAIQLLAVQLYDPELEVCRLAVSVLEEFCQDPENLEHFVKLQPSLIHLGDVGTPLLLQFLSTSSGFRYLRELDYVHVEMDNWFHGEIDNYVKVIGEYLEMANTEAMSRYQAVVHQVSLLPGGVQIDTGFPMPPRHFYGEITRTEEGCQLLESKGHFPVFAQFVSHNKKEAADKEVILRLKGCLWAIGHIASNPLGTPFLEDSDVTKDIIDIAENSFIPSLKGTAFFVLGLIASTHEGAEILDEFGWVTVRDPSGTPQGISLPKNLSSAFKSQNNDRGEKEDEFEEEAEFPRVHSDAVKRKIIDALCNLSNQILANEASKLLVKTEMRYPSLFQNVDLFLEAMELLEKYRYKLPVRRFIFELFDTSALLEKLAKKHKEYIRRARLSGDSSKISGPLSVSV